MISALQRQEQWETSIPIIVNLLGQYPAEKTVAIRLNLAKTLIAKTDQPQQGLAVLKKLPLQRMDEKQQVFVKKLAKLAKQKQEAGAVELDIHDW